ncbi:hypothetical protein APHWI1_1504 [Anaplasma phagocytophilum str. ApWI1]|uniref:Uncharacterized protein n=3 Tax=Anaplasma phagocytophilum TaxID=948 RepID=Q2GKN6_ANAPZ|nr:hypothetical protein [Anaplasma phagocytophilum]ABD43769.1 hypothetical protein APH_0464 [Anaplasma phagocytophilum str. HZ]AGR79333.1 hypothetical protein YYU_02280 [Anaplasma phagocytophilum str. HZ2]AGR80579.1 hypothetical protein WSQ_02275 [Anaplasma phagocytophilum str. JM]AGR81839.1 hypothetical protein YYY_02305 [Anaplasma phagocytophilum str. Dog2]EOA60826.1 hypothetical protein HGE1_02152 [Anaplasma phagocytophilum str. HGE1]KJV60982.1 hypothetical protein APHWEB_0014 [Anaplasma p
MALSQKFTQVGKKIRGMVVTMPGKGIDVWVIWEFSSGKQHGNG